MKRWGGQRSIDSRAVSNQVAAVLLIGLVVTGAGIVSLVGGQSLDEVQDQVQGESTEQTMREVDARVSSLSAESSDSRATLNFGGLDSEDVFVAESGYVNVTVDRRHDCGVNVSLRSIRIREDGSTVRGYEMGGIFVRQDDSSVMASPPQLRYQNGSIALTVTNFTGDIDESEETITKDVAASDAATRTVTQRLRHGDCGRPDNVTITIRSDFSGAYFDYLKQELDYTSIDHYESNDTVRAYLGQSKLPPATNDSRNQVVNLSGASYGTFETTNNSVRVEKGTPRNYSLSVQPLANGVERSRVINFDDQAVPREPLDVIFVVDESGSMDNNPSGDASSKAAAAQEGMREFLGILNASKDRAGLIGFYDPSDQDFDYYLTNGNYFTSDFDDMNDTINTTRDKGGTHLNAGMREAAALADLRSNSSREKVIVVLSDGENDADHLDDKSIAWANRSAENGATVYTIGFDKDRSDIDEAMLKKMTYSSDGRYFYAENVSTLLDAFEAIAQQVTATKAVALEPVSMGLNDSSQTLYPQAPGGSDLVANTTGPGGSPVINVNDPAVHSAFSFSLTVQDGDNVTMHSLTYSCSRYEATAQSITNESTGEEFLVTRCADINESSKEVVPPSDTTLYTDGDNVSALLDDEEAWFQSDLRNDTLAPYLTANDTLELDSNQAIVVFDYENEGRADNRMVVLYEIGAAESERTASAVQMTVNNVSVGADG